MQGARRSALYFTCQCLTPFLLLWLQASVTEGYYMETTTCFGESRLFCSHDIFLWGGGWEERSERTVNEAEYLRFTQACLCS